MTKSTTFFSTNNLRDITTYQSGVVQAKAFRELKKFVAKILAEHGLTSTQWYMLGMVFDAGEEGITMSELADTLGIKLATLVIAANALEYRGFITKNPSKKDARVKMLRMSNAQKALIPEIEAQIRSAMRQTLYKDITPEELTIYIKVLYKMLAIFAKQ